MYTDLLDKGYASLRRGDPDAALIRFQHAAESEPECPQAYFGMAMVYIEQDSSDEAVNALEKALSTAYHKCFPSLTKSPREDRLGVGGESTCEVPNPLIQLH